MTNTDRLSTALADRYRIVEHLGEGGMANVYLAQDLKHDRKVAIKVLRPELAAVIGAERFLAEIKTTANLQHPHILPLHDSGEIDGTVFYVMPFVEGESLRDLLDREKQLAIDDAVGIASEVASALDYAHRHGVIHRDIKPENILLHDRRALVADFGIALAASRSDSNARLTETGMSLGTPHYMSPEQAMGERDLDARTDVYALSCVLYEMLAGEPPFTGPTAQAIVAKVMTADPEPITTYRKTTPANVAMAIATGLQKLPADRFVSAEDFADALTDTRAPAVPTGRTTSGFGPVLPFAVVSIVLVVVAAWGWLRPSSTPKVVRYALALPPDQVPDPNQLAIPTADGSRIVYVGPSVASTRTLGQQLWAKDRIQHTARPIGGTDGATTFAVSPDGAWVAFSNGGLLYKVPIEGGTPQMILPTGTGGRVGGLVWLEDDTIVYTSTSGGRRLGRISSEGGEPTTVLESDSLTFDALSPLPDSRGVLYQACAIGCTTSSIWVLDLEDGTNRELVTDAAAGHYLPSGHLAYVRGGGSNPMLAVPFNLATYEVGADPVPLLDSIALTGSVPLLAVSRSGTLVMRSGAGVANQRFEFVWVNRSGQIAAVDSGETFSHVDIAANIGWALSPDGGQVAIGLASATGDDIWVKTLPRGPLSRMSYDQGGEFRPRWMPDGRRVVYGGRDGETDGVFIKRSDGTGAEELVVEGLFDEAAISPDGRWLVLRSGASSGASGGRDLLAMEVGVDSVPRPLLVSQYDEMAFRLSPDGRAIAYQSDETGRTEIFVRPFPNVDDARIQVSDAGGTGPLWNRNGREIFYRDDDARMIAVPITLTPRLAPGEPEVLFQIPPTIAVINALFYTPWDVAPDGRFLMTRSMTGPSLLEAPLVVVENWFEEVKEKLGN